MFMRLPLAIYLLFSFIKSVIIISLSTSSFRVSNHRPLYGPINPRIGEVNPGVFEIGKTKTSYLDAVSGKVVKKMRYGEGD